MKILSVNVGLPRRVISGGEPVSTSIYKAPVHGRVKVGRLNLEGDAQADLSVHGGPNKAVYAYPSEHYPFWRSELPGMDLPWGAFGENLTLEGLMEDEAHIGDCFRIGTATLMVTQPRRPCYKLGIKFGRDDIIERFLSSGRTGFYFAVVEEGELGEGDTVERITQDPNEVSVATLLRLHADHSDTDDRLLERTLQIEALPPGWRRLFQKRLDESRVRGL